MGGDDGQYRSTVNYRSGAYDCSAQPFDRFQGRARPLLRPDSAQHDGDSGNDPYEFVSLRVQKNQLYRYDMTWRLQDYYNPGLTVAGGLHLMDTVRRIQDHELTYFRNPSSARAWGYSRNVQDGPSLTTSLEPDNNSALSTALPVFVNLRREWNEYRMGGDVELRGSNSPCCARWDFYKEDSPYRLSARVPTRRRSGCPTI